MRRVGLQADRLEIWVSHVVGRRCWAAERWGGEADAEVERVPRPRELQSERASRLVCLHALSIVDRILAQHSTHFVGPVLASLPSRPSRRGSISYTCSCRRRQIRQLTATAGAERSLQGSGSASSFPWDGHRDRHPVYRCLLRHASWWL